MNVKEEAEEYLFNLAPHIKERQAAKHIEALLKQLKSCEREALKEYKEST